MDYAGALKTRLKISPCAALSAIPQLQLRADLPLLFVSSLHSGMASSSPIEARLILHRSLLYMHRTIKALSSNRMAKGRLMMREFSQHLFPTLVQLHGQLLESAINQLNLRGLDVTRAKCNEGEVEDFDLVLLAFKCLTTLLIYGFEKPAEDEVARVSRSKTLVERRRRSSSDFPAQTFFTNTTVSFSTLFSLRNSHVLNSASPQSSRVLILMTKSLIAYGKLYRRLLSHDVAIFLALGLGSQISSMYWKVIQGASEDLEKNVSGTISFSDRLSLC